VELLILLLLAATVITIIIGGTYFTCRRVQDYCALQAKREELAARIRNSRLGRMLRSLNIGLHDYLHKFPVSTISSQLSTCGSCDASVACDAYLADGRRNPDSAREFCPNMNALQGLKQETPDATA
jgi:hypothetical protein